MNRVQLKTIAKQPASGKFSYIGPAILLNIMIAIFTCLWSLVFAFCHSGNHQGNQLFHGILCFS